MGTPPYWRLLRVVRRVSMRPRCSCRWRSASASLILPGQPRHDRLHLRDLVRRQREERLVGEDFARQPLALAPGAALQLALDVLADHAAEGLEPQLEIVADTGELAGVEPLRLEHGHDLGEIALDGRHVEVFGDAPREIADLQEVHQPLEPHVAPPERMAISISAPSPRIRSSVSSSSSSPSSPQLVEQALHPRVLGAERLPEALPEGLQVQEVEVEDAVEGSTVTRLLDEGRGQGRLERLAILEPDLGAARSARRAPRRSRCAPRPA